MFTGEFKHAVDSKGRVAIPARFRLQLEDGAVITKWVDGCAAIFPRGEFEQFATKVAALPLADERARAVARFIFKSAFDVETDAQGRILLPPAIREWADLRSEATVVGHYNYVELWSPDRLQASQHEVASSDGLAGHMSGLVL
jgi:MraZ protein